MKRFLSAAPGAAIKPEPFVPSGEKPTPSWSDPDVLAGSPPVRFASGAASPFIGLAQLAANAAGQGEGFNEHMRRFAEMEQSGREKLGSEGFDWTKAAGTALSPAWRAGPAPATTLTGKVAQGAGFGAAGGLTAPVTSGGDFWSEKAVQTGVGTGLGVATPLAAVPLKWAARTGYHGLFEPLVKPAAIKGRAYLEAAGDKYKNIIELLQQNRQIVPGSLPTAGEAAAPAGRAEFSALQKSAEKVLPSEYLARADKQNEARRQVVEAFAGTPAKMEAAAAVRSTRAEPFYEKGVKEVSDTSGLSELMKRPSSRAVFNRAERLARERSKDFTELFPNKLPRSITGEEAQTLKLAFDDMIKAYPKSGMDTAELNAIKSTRGEFIKWMEARFPSLGSARKMYKMTSGPINQLEVGRELSNKLTPALREDAAQRGNVFAGAVRESAGVIKKATGEPRFKELEDVLTSRQLQAVHSVQDDLARSARMEDMARRGAGSANAIDLATASLQREAGGKVPNLLHRGAMLVNAIITRMEGKINEKLAREIAAEMLNPPKVAESLQQAAARRARNEAIAEALAVVRGPALATTAALLPKE
jgi:hypothetical protein